MTGHAERLDRQNTVGFLDGFPTRPAFGNDSSIWMDAPPPSPNALKAASLGNNFFIQQFWFYHDFSFRLHAPNPLPSDFAASIF
jgi:hypothetical protein